MAIGTFINFVNMPDGESRPKQRHMLLSHMQTKLISESFEAVKR